MSNKIKGTSVTNALGRIICISDIHGIPDELSNLLDLIQPTSIDTIVFLGDFLDRGPDSAGVCDIVMKNGYMGILGNHEDRHLGYRKLEEKGKDPKVGATTHVETRKQLKDHHYEWFKTLPHYIRFPQYNAVAVHAGVFPGIPIEDQSDHTVLHIQNIYPEGGTKQSMWPSKSPPEWKFWTNFYNGSEKIIFGHSVLSKPLITDKVAGIDLGGVFGGELCAYELGTEKLYRVQCKHDYGKGKRGRSNENIKTFPVQNDVLCYS
jgi:hypothetical protein